MALILGYTLANANLMLGLGVRASPPRLWHRIFCMKTEKLTVRSSHSHLNSWIIILQLIIQAKAGIQYYFNKIRAWIPDQVRHDGKNFRLSSEKKICFSSSDMVCHHYS
jgi:hypothetical protein